MCGVKTPRLTQVLFKLEGSWQWMKYHFSSQSGRRLRRFFKRSPMDTGYDDRLPAEEICASNKTDLTAAGIFEVLAN